MRETIVLIAKDWEGLSTARNATGEGVASGTLKAPALLVLPRNSGESGVAASCVAHQVHCCCKHTHAMCMGLRHALGFHTQTTGIARA